MAFHFRVCVASSSLSTSLISKLRIDAHDGLKVSLLAPAIKSSVLQSHGLSVCEHLCMMHQSNRSDTNPLHIVVY